MTEYLEFKCPKCGSDLILDTKVISTTITVEIRITTNGAIERDMSTMTGPDEDLSGYFKCGGCAEGIVDRHGDVISSPQGLVTYLIAQKGAKR